MARLTRQEMKRDEVLETASRALHYLTTHTRGMILGVVGIAVVALIVAGVLAYLQGRSARANALFAEALEVYQAEIVSSVADSSSGDPSFPSEEARDLQALELFESLEESYGGTSVGRIAAVYRGKLALRAGDAAAARDHWERFVANGDDHMLTAAVRLDLLALDQAEGKGEEVAERLREMVASGADDLPVEVALNQLATLLEDLRRPEEARSVYQRLVDEFPASPYAARARQRLSVL